MDMDEKSYDLLGKIYTDLQETKNNISRIESKVDNTQKEVVKLGIKIEHDVSDKVQILFEAQQGTQEHLEDMKSS
jgi:hypothetical protein